MKPIFALVGRPNVGKSTLFNKLTKSMDALVADVPGLTRDRKYGDGKLGDFSYTVVDTGGLNGEEEGVSVLMAEQTFQAIDEADIVFFMVDGRAGLTVIDEEIAARLRRISKKVCLVINKIDGVGEDQASVEFFSLGLGNPQCIAAAHNRGLGVLLDHVVNMLKLQDKEDGLIDESDNRVRVGIIGRPNVGKSTLINRLIGENRVVSFDKPGTTRDVIAVPFQRGRRSYTLVDTAGVRRRGKISEIIEKFSVIKTLQAIENCNVCLLMLSATESIADQDLNLIGYTIDKGRALVVVINKWDDIDHTKREQLKLEIKRRMGFLTFTRIHFISALQGSGVEQLFSSINKAYDSALADLSTPVLTRMLEHAVSAHQPPMVHGRRIKLRYAHQGGVNPPIIVIHGNQVERVPKSYKKYLINFFQKELNLFGTPVRVQFSTKQNPFAMRVGNQKLRQKFKRTRIQN